MLLRFFHNYWYANVKPDLAISIQSFYKYVGRLFIRKPQMVQTEPAQRKVTVNTCGDSGSMSSLSSVKSVHIEFDMHEDMQF